MNWYFYRYTFKITKEILAIYNVILLIKTTLIKSLSKFIGLFIIIMEKMAFNLGGIQLINNLTRSRDKTSNYKLNKSLNQGYNEKLAASFKSVHSTNNRVLDLLSQPPKTSRHQTKQVNIDKRSVQMKKVLDQHKVLFESIQLMQAEKKQTLQKIEYFKESNAVLVKNYETILRYIQNIPPQQIDEQILEVKALCLEVLKSTSRKPSSSIQQADSLKRSPKFLHSRSLKQSVIKRSASMQTDQIEIMEPLQLLTKKTQQKGDMPQRIRVLQAQNQELRQKLMRSQQSRSQKLNSLKSIIGKSNVNKSQN